MSPIVSEPNQTVMSQGTNGEKQAANHRKAPPTVLAPASLNFAAYRPAVRSSLGAQQAIPASRHDEALIAWLASRPGTREQIAESDATENWDCEVVLGASDILNDSIEQVFAQLASN